MAWLKITHELPEKPEVFEVAQILGLEDPDTVVGKLIRLWSWFDRQTLDGCAGSVTSAQLDRNAGVTGMCAALEKVGWLYRENDQWRVSNFEKHISESAKARALASKRMKKKRGEKCCAASATPSLSYSLSSSSNKKKMSAEIFELSKNLDRSDVRAAIDDWLKHRQEIKKPVTKLQMDKTLARYDDPAKFVAAVNHTISNGWQGLRDPEPNATASKSEDYDLDYFNNILGGKPDDA